MRDGFKIGVGWKQLSKPVKPILRKREALDTRWAQGRVGKRDQDSKQGGMRVIASFSRHSSLFFYLFVILFSFAILLPLCFLLFSIHLARVAEGHF